MKTRLDMLATSIPAIKGLCFMFSIGISCRLFDGALVWNVVGLAGALIGFTIFTYRIFILSVTTKK